MEVPAISSALASTRNVFHQLRDPMEEDLIPLFAQSPTSNQKLPLVQDQVTISSGTLCKLDIEQWQALSHQLGALAEVKTTHLARKSNRLPCQVPPTTTMCLNVAMSIELSRRRTKMRDTRSQLVPGTFKDKSISQRTLLVLALTTQSYLRQAPQSPSSVVQRRKQTNTMEFPHLVSIA